mmetsp:Transcript_40178/g.92956  ORF Transcript_40178/g.92956 Transcript_40178/m.92956 type:complete len:542 (-) Transcript_40178:30-1655(-)
MLLRWWLHSFLVSFIAALRDNSGYTIKGQQLADFEGLEAEEELARESSGHNSSAESAQLQKLWHFAGSGEPEDLETPSEGTTTTTSAAAATSLPAEIGEEQAAPTQVEVGMALREEQEEIGFGLAVFFFATLMWDMFLLWMLLSPDPQVRSYSVKTISSCMAIFMALSIEHAELGLVVNGFALKKIKGLLFCLHWVAIPMVTWGLRGSHVNFAAAVHILAHVAAFLGICTANKLFVKVRKATESYGHVSCIGAQGACLLALAALAWGAVLLTRRIIRGRLGLGSPEHEPASHDAEAHHSSLTKAEFLQEVDEANMEAACILVSYLAKNWIVFSLFLWCGFGFTESDLMTLEKPEESRMFITYLSAVTLGIYGVLAILQGAAPYILQNSAYKHYLTLLNFTTAWTSAALIKWITCFFLLDETCIRVTSAMICTILGCSLLILVDKLADFSLIGEPEAEALVKTFGFMIGCSWEKAFAAASHEIVKHLQHLNLINHESFENEDQVVISIVTVLVLLPGWRYLVLPKALQPTPPRFLEKETAQS